MRSRDSESARYMEAARRVIVRGVGSAMRATERSTPLVVSDASGARLVDLEGNEYLDYVLAFGPMLLGHSPACVTRAVREQLSRGVLFGGQHEGELELARRIVETVPGAEIVALSSTGSEAVHAALRFACAATGRRKIIKFEGHYHGWIDPIFVNGPHVSPSEGSSPFEVRHGVPGLPSPRNILVLPWNDLEALNDAMRDHGSDVAAVIMEPVPCNFGNFEPGSGYLAGVREICDRFGSVLIFDEVITGFRLALGGAQERFEVTPDLTVLAKVIASGFPLAVVAGKRSVMSVAAEGPVRHIGTYNGNAVSVAAAIATLERLDQAREPIYTGLNSTSEHLATELGAAAEEAGAPLVVNRVGSVLQLFWTYNRDVRDVASYADAFYRARPEPIAEFAAQLRRQGIYALERGLWFLSVEHGAQEIELTVAAVKRSIPPVQKEFPE